jgi:hypothetical protein
MKQLWGHLAPWLIGLTVLIAWIIFKVAAGMQ